MDPFALYSIIIFGIALAVFLIVFAIKKIIKHIKSKKEEIDK